jgi:ribonuclease P protein component
MSQQYDERFPRSVRLVHQRDFDRVFASKVVLTDDTLVVHVCRNELGWTRLGLSISKRVGCAPVRNRWKRLIREAFRKQKHRLPTGYDLAVRPRKDAEANLEKISESFSRLGKRIARKFETDR